MPGILLSLCMIVKDEEKNLPRCLDSVRGVADEIVVVDTGSRDATREIARNVGARVIEEPWRGSFAAARNASIEGAAGDWIFWLDADETLEAEPGALRRALENASSPLLPIACVHYTGAAADEAETWRVTLCRFFRSGLSLRFAGDIHEHFDLESPAGRAVRGRYGDALLGPRLPGRILHRGYLDAALAEKDKARRNLSLIEAAMHGDFSPWLPYHRALELYRLGLCREALAETDNALSRFLAKGMLPPAVCYRFKYNLLLLFAEPQNTLAGLERALALYPDYVDLWYCRGLLLQRLGRIEEAEEAFCRCLELGEADRGYLSLAGCGSHAAAVSLGECAERAGEREKAAQAYELALRFRPGWPRAREGLRRVASGPR